MCQSALKHFQYDPKALVSPSGNTHIHINLKNINKRNNINKCETISKQYFSFTPELRNTFFFLI